MQHSAFFCILFRSFSKEQNVLAFFYVLCKRTKRSLHSFTFFVFFYVLKKRMHRSFGPHKSPKTRKNNVKEHCIPERKRSQRPTLCDYNYGPSWSKRVLSAPCCDNNYSLSWSKSVL